MLRRVAGSLRNFAPSVRYSVAAEADQSYPQSNDPAVQAQVKERYHGPQPHEQKKHSKNVTYGKITRQFEKDSCTHLRDVQASMTEYRRQRDNAKNGEPVPVSDLVTLILKSVRRRMYVLRPVISVDRKNVIAFQDQALFELLTEITDDLVEGRAYVTKVAFLYLLTSLKTVRGGAAATAAWVKLYAKRSSPWLSNVVNDQQAVTGALLNADPSQMDLDALETTYNDSVALHGRNAGLDHALCQGLIQFGESVRAAKLYTDMCDMYDVDLKKSLFNTLHNHFISYCKDYDVTKAFFDSMIRKNFSLQLHPSAAAHYASLVYKSTGDFDKVFEVYVQSMANFHQQGRYGAQDTNVVTCNLLSILLDRYPRECQEARDYIHEILKVFTGFASLQLNSVLSALTKQWPASETVEELVNIVLKRKARRVDVVRVALNAMQGLDSFSVDQISKLWSQRLAMDAPLQYYDWIALVTSATGDPARAEFVASVIRDAVSKKEIPPRIHEDLWRNMVRFPPLPEYLERLNIAPLRQGAHAPTMQFPSNTYPWNKPGSKKAVDVKPAFTEPLEAEAQPTASEPVQNEAAPVKEEEPEVKRA